ncbi:MAG: site-2 protease family protein [Caldilineaceae bacterium]|nr:site-2 protease family protein [Caldilineaceae bacterium]
MSDSLAVLSSEPVDADIAARVRRVVGSDLTIESIEVPRDIRQGILVLRGRLTVPSHAAFRRWLAELRPLGYTPMLRPEPEAGHEAVALYIIAGVPRQARSRPWINLVLFLLTVISTLFVGSLYGGDLNGVSQISDLFLPQNLIRGWPFSFTLLGILVAHEFGHYFAARYHKVAVTLPFFIPLPIGFGTLGAFIQLKEPVPDRRKLFDIGVAGPLAGLILAIPLLFLGLSTSPVDIPPVGANVQLEGNSILYYFAKIAVFGKALPNPITGEDVFMNQVTFAAWIGLLVTALNLLPVGQLDGGHTVYALFGRSARYANWATLVVMAFLAIAGLEPVQAIWPVLRNFGFTGWWLWLGMIVFVLGPHHPPALDDVTQLDARRRLVGYLVIAVFILTFVPTPFRIL